MEKYRKVPQKFPKTRNNALKYDQIRGAGETIKHKKNRLIMRFSLVLNNGGAEGTRTLYLIAASENTYVVHHFMMFRKCFIYADI